MLGFPIVWYAIEIVLYIIDLSAQFLVNYLPIFPEDYLYCTAKGASLSKYNTYLTIVSLRTPVARKRSDESDSKCEQIGCESICDDKLFELNLAACSGSMFQSPELFWNFESPAKRLNT